MFNVIYATDVKNVEVEKIEGRNQVEIKLDELNLFVSPETLKKICATGNKILAEEEKIISRFYIIKSKNILTLMPKGRSCINDYVFQEIFDDDGNYIRRIFHYSPHEGYKLNMTEYKWYKSQKYSQLCRIRLEEMEKAKFDYGQLTASAIGREYEKQIHYMEEFPFEF